MTYSVDLFTGRNVFQKDYANVLQFDTPQARDQFFDSQTRITVQNTEFVHVSNDKTNITLTFTNTLTPEQQSQLDYAKFNYCRINYELVTESPLTSQQKSHYYFIDSYRIVSSTTDRTVVRFAISEDIWTNYQFSVNFMPTLVERKHCDRWYKYGGTHYWFNINPNRDRLQQMNYTYTPSELTIPKVTVRVCTSVTKSERQEDTNYYYTVNPVYQERHIGIVWALIQFTNNYKDSYDQQQFALVPIQTEGFDFIPHHPQHIEDYVVGQIQADSEFRSETEGGSGTTHQEMYGSCFLTLAMLESQGQSLVLRDEDDYAVTINSIQILPALPVTDNSSEIIHYDNNGRQYIHFNNESMFLVEKSFNVVPVPNSNESLYRYFFKQWVTDSIERLETLKQSSPGDLSCVRLGYFTPSLPQPPSQTGEFSENNEPMMFFEPVMTRTLMTRDGQSSTSIPDIVFNPNQYPWTVNSTYNLYLSMTLKLSPSRCELTYYIYPIEQSAVEITDDLRQQIIGLTLKQKSYLFDILNDTYADYCVRQRDIDRRMMYMNILTGGIQESGSTAVSQGIGYRSNMERANKEQIVYDTNGGVWDPLVYSRSDQLSSMYKNYQTSQAQMSQVGGLQAFGSNAIGQTARFEQLQEQMKNSSSIVSQMADWQDQVQNGKLGVTMIETVCDRIQRQKYLELFTKYGYQVNSVQVPDLKTRKYFDYIKTGGQVLSTDLNQYIQSQLCMIFDNGVTLWHMDNCQTQDFILNHVYEYDNTERALLTGGGN